MYTQLSFNLSTGVKPCVKCGAKERYKNGHCKACKRVYAKNNKDKIAEYRREYYENNKEKHTEYMREYRGNNKDKRAEYLEDNKDKIAEYNREYAKNNPEVKRGANCRRRAAKAKVNSEPYDFVAICERYGNKCLACGSTSSKLTIDHVIPISLGGDDIESNIQPLCKSCNSSKGNYHATDYRRASQT